MISVEGTNDGGPERIAWVEACPVGKLRLSQRSLTGCADAATPHLSRSMLDRHEFTRGADMLAVQTHKLIAKPCSNFLDKTSLGILSRVAEFLPEPLAG